MASAWQDIRCNWPAILLHDAINQCNIRFGDPLALKLDGQQSVRQMVFGQGDDTAGISIKPVDDSRFRLTGKVGVSIEIKLNGVGQCPRGILSRGMHDQSRRLIDDQQPAIFEDDSKRDFFGRHQVIGGFQQPDRDGLIGEDAAIRGGDFPFHRHLTGANHSMHSPRRIAAKMFCQKRVDATSRQVTFDDQRGRMHRGIRLYFDSVDSVSGFWSGSGSGSDRSFTSSSSAGAGVSSISSPVRDAR